MCWFYCIPFKYQNLLSKNQCAKYGSYEKINSQTFKVKLDCFNVRRPTLQHVSLHSSDTPINFDVAIDRRISIYIQIYWTYILYSLLQFEHMWTINLLVIIYINTSTIDFYKFGIKSAVCFFLRHPANPRWQPLCRSDSTRSERVSVTRTNCRWKWSIPANLSVCVL